MNNTSNLGAGVVGTFITFIGASLSVTDIQAIISIVFTVVGFSFTLITNLIIPALKKWRNITKDGKITNEELDEFVDVVKDGIESVNKQGKEH